MPEWMLHMFGTQQLNKAFWFASLMTLPFWVLMLFFPRLKLTQLTCRPFRAPVLYLYFWGYLLYQFIEVGLPSLPGRAGFADFQAWVGHPLPFLLLWVQVQIMNLVIGTLLYEKERESNGARLWPEMLITWLFGPLGMIAYWVRMVLRWLFLRSQTGS